MRALLISGIFLTLVIRGYESYTLKPKFWTFKGHPISYEIANNEVDENKKVAPTEDPILLLNGFGVGSFHQHRLMEQLKSVHPKNIGPQRLVYGIDYLGQGKSWPIACNDGEADCERGLIYSADTWVDQIIAFIEEIIIPNQKNNETKVHLVGNSVGGYLSVVIGLKRPDLISSITLLNATPVWGLNLPGWSGHLPAPYIPKKVGRYLFDRIRDLNNIEKYLVTAYSNRSAFGDDLIKAIRSCTEGPGGHAAFASILWSPPASVNQVEEVDFISRLTKLKCDVLLVFGKDDPWCTPAFAKKMLTSLNTRSSFAHRYIELSNVGHCPNHEAPQAVANILKCWISSGGSDRKNANLLSATERDTIHESWGEVGMREINLEEAKNLNILDEIIVKIVC